MKRLKTAAVLAAILILALLAACATTEKKEPEEDHLRNYIASGTIVNLKGESIKVERFVYLEPYLSFTYQGSRHSTPIILIKSLADIGNGYLNMTTIDGRSYKIVATMGSISQRDAIYFQIVSLVRRQPETPAQAEADKEKKNIEYEPSRIDGEATKQIDFIWTKKPYKETKQD